MKKEQMQREGIIPIVIQVTPTAADMLEGMHECDN